MQAGYRAAESADHRDSIGKVDDTLGLELGGQRSTPAVEPKDPAEEGVHGVTVTGRATVARASARLHVQRPGIVSPAGGVRVPGSANGEAAGALLGSARPGPVMLVNVFSPAGI